MRTPTDLKGFVKSDRCTVVTPTARTAERARAPLRTKRDIIYYVQQYFDTNQFFRFSFFGIKDGSLLASFYFQRPCFSAAQFVIYGIENKDKV